MKIPYPAVLATAMAAAALTSGGWPATASAGVPSEAREGAALFRDSAYQEAADAFRQATIAAPEDLRWRYDLGLSEALNQEFESALNNLSTTAGMAPAEIAAPSIYNAGNIHFAMQDYAEAAAAYRRALVRNPDDADAKHNLELALQMLQQAEQGQKPDSTQDGENEQGENENQNQQNQQKEQQDQQDPGEQDDMKDPEQNQENQPQDQNPQQNPTDDQQSQQTDSSLTREQAERILRALADEEARLRDQARRLQAIPAPGGKDW